MAGVSLDELVNSAKDIAEHNKAVEFIELNKRGCWCRPIPALKIGNGPKVLISTYGVHGNEEAAILSFRDSPKWILGHFDGRLDDFTFYAVLMSPWAVSDGTRYCKPTPERERDPNSEWGKDAKDTAPCVKAEAKFFEEIIRQYEAPNILHLAHRECGMKISKPYFVPVEGTALRDYFPGEYDPKSEMLKALRPKICYIVGECAKFFDANGVDYYKKKEIIDDRYEEMFRKAPFKPNMADPTNLGSAGNFFMERGVASVAFKTSMKLGIFDRMFRAYDAHLVSRLRAHCMADIAFLEALAREPATYA